MASLIESLTEGENVQRRVPTSIRAPQRPPPQRLRELLEMFGNLGHAASLGALKRSLLLADTDPAALINALLGRLPSSRELTRLRHNGYAPWVHLRSILLSTEFRTPLVRRVLDAFPEKTRLLHVRIPGTAGQHVLATIESAGPLLPTDAGSPAYAEPEALAGLLGRICARVSIARAIGVSATHLTTFTDPPAVHPAGPDPLHWAFQPVPCRNNDVLFAIIRPPFAQALNQVNGTLTALRDTASDAQRQAFTERFGPLPQADRKQWKRLAHEILPAFAPQNPICHALADGTEAGALAACARTPLLLVALEEYSEWARSTIDPNPRPPIAPSDRFLSEDDLTGEEKSLLNARLAEDLRFIARFEARRRETGFGFVRGAELAV